MLECKSGTALSVWRQVPSLNKKFVGKIFVGDTSLSEKFSWMEANHENNEIKSTTKIFTYTVSFTENFTTDINFPFSVEYVYSVQNRAEWYWDFTDGIVLLLQYCGITKLLWYE